ncbi:hypothetical protein [Actinomadura rugatobispora]|uniref:Uncharacterized protein n=1 Tax=Actinomadura rugatobispora TaxID=1994 RepID=A0ABW0ZQZ3_9ACTN|nr:hypothetical protein GCM10010200_035780 [Actinomadura rugatobispora]
MSEQIDYEAGRLARQDQRWQDAQAAYVAEYEDVDPDVAFVERVKAATRMRVIEREYENDGRPAA